MLFLWEILTEYVIDIIKVHYSITMMIHKIHWPRNNRECIQSAGDKDSTQSQRKASAMLCNIIVILLQL